MFVYSYYTFTICIHWCYQHTTFFIPTHLLKKKNTDVYRDQTHLYPLQNNNVRNILYNIQFDSRFFFFLAELYFCFFLFFGFVLFLAVRLLAYSQLYYRYRVCHTFFVTSPFRISTLKGRGNSPMHNTAHTETHTHTHTRERRERLF